MTHLATNETVAVQRINETIDSFFEHNITESAHINSYYEQLWRDMHRLAMSGGKRLRPRMVLRSYAAFGGTDYEAILPIAATQELMHMSLLIHDDIIDRDDVRYGVDNIMGKYEKEYYAHVIDVNDRRHYAQSAALLAGDLLLSGSYELMLETGIDPTKLLAVQKIHGQSIFAVAGGELIDTESAFRQMGEIDAQTVALYKTAIYTFVGPLLIGAILADASSEQKKDLEAFARHLGVAYQLRDDVIGTFGDENKIGKTTIGDIREGKHTYMVEQFFALASDEEKTYFNLYFGDKDIQKSEVETIKKLLVSTGALQRTEDAINTYSQDARSALSKIRIENEYMNELYDLVDIVTKRDK